MALQGTGDTLPCSAEGTGDTEGTAHPNHSDRGLAVHTSRSASARAHPHRGPEPQAMLNAILQLLRLLPICRI